MKMKAWDVYFKGKSVDTVFYEADCNAEYVKRSLVEHDGYQEAIVVRPSPDPYGYDCDDADWPGEYEPFE